MIDFIKSLYLHRRFFVVVFLLALGFFIAFWLPGLYPVIWVLSVLFLLLFATDCILLFSKNPISGKRQLPDKFSNSDENKVHITLKNHLNFAVYSEIIEEIPIQFQKRDFLKKIILPAGETLTFHYFLKPVTRGEYFFGRLNIYSASPLKLIKRRGTFQEKQKVKVYPSFIQMKKYDFLAIDSRQAQRGFKKIRKIGHTMEFEQIKDYVLGDDMRTINWKASAKSGNLMVNQFQDEKAQPIYSIIDSGRAMKMPFSGLKLLDYAINASLAFSNIALKKKDKVGLISFSNSMGKIVPANAKKSQLSLILERLYSINTHFLESDFGLLYAHIKRKVPQRSLLMLYTNFEHKSSLQRELPYLRALAKTHLLVVILFENTLLTELINTPATKIPEIFNQTIAEQFWHEKQLMARELNKHGIQTVLSKPQDLSANTINKYLEIKKRRML